MLLIIIAAVVPFQLLLMYVVIIVQRFFRKTCRTAQVLVHTIAHVDTRHRTKSHRRGSRGGIHVDRELIAGIVPLVRSLMGLD